MVMGKSVDIKSVTQNFIGLTDALTNIISDYIIQEKLHSLKKQLIP